MSRSFAFRCERFEHVPDGTSVAVGKPLNGPPIRVGDVFDGVWGPGRAERWLSLTITSISTNASHEVAELRQGQLGNLGLTGAAPPDIEGGWLLIGASDVD